MSVPKPTQLTIPSPTVPYGTCHCGCGTPTSISTKRRPGIQAGEPMRYLLDHYRLTAEQRARQTKTLRTRGWSERQHAAMQRRYPPVDPVERLWSLVDKSGECWLWKGTHNRGGYGSFRANRMRYVAHRVAWESVNGPLPPGYLVCHHCDTPACCRPDHLFAGTHLDNSRDMVAKGRQRFSCSPGGRGDRHGTHTHPEAYPWGERHPKAKLTDAKVRELRIRHANGTPCTELAREYGVTRMVVKRAIQRKTWKHVA